MTNIRRFVRCPVCDKLLVLSIDDNLQTDRWPLRLELKHEDHEYMILLDSRYAVTEIKEKAAKIRESQAGVHK